MNMSSHRTTKEESAMKRLLALAIAAIIFLAAFAGCSASQSTAYDNEGPYATTAATTTYAGGDGQGSGLDGNPSAERKIIRDANLALEVSDVVKAYNDILAYARQYDGYEISRSQTRSNGYIAIQARIKIKPDQLDAFIEFIGKQGTVINTQITTEDITEDYYDIQTRLKTMESTLLTYYDFLNRAKTIDESLQVQYQINQLTAEIESLKGKIKLWDSLLAESVVTLNLRQSEDPVKIKKEINWSTLTFDDMGYLMRSGLTGVLNFLANAIQWLAIALVVTAPFWIAGLIVLFILLRRKKKQRQQKQNIDKPVPPAPPAG
jgi:hypothetical protein